MCATITAENPLYKLQMGTTDGGGEGKANKRVKLCQSLGRASSQKKSWDLEGLLILVTQFIFNNDH